LGGIDLTVEVLLRSAQMREAGMEPFRLSRGSLTQMYWTLAQMLTHHTSNGCNLRSGDLLASGTVSGAEEGSRGCLLEITQRGSKPIELPTGEIRSFLSDSDDNSFADTGERRLRQVGFGGVSGQSSSS
jgi:fumarylacetoacetase